LSKNLEYFIAAPDESTNVSIIKSVTVKRYYELEEEFITDLDRPQTICLEAVFPLALSLISGGRHNRSVQQ
jgi:hypothetical protein